MGFQAFHSPEARYYLFPFDKTFTCSHPTSTLQVDTADGMKCMFVDKAAAKENERWFKICNF